MTLGVAVLWLHVLAAAVWLGGLLYEGHVLAPLMVRGQVAPATFREAHRRGRRVAWSAIGLLLLTGLYNLGSLGVPLGVLFEQASGPLLALKLLLALVVLSLAAHRDFGLLPRVVAARERGEAPGASSLRLRWLDRVIVLLAVAILFLGIAVSRRV